MTQNSEDLAEAVTHNYNIVERTKYVSLQYCSMATECISCNYEASKDEGRVVGTVTGDYGPICNECWALLLHDETVLSDRESDVAALRDMDLPPFEIADILGLEESTVYTYIGRIHDKVERAHRTVDEIGHMTVER